MPQKEDPELGIGGLLKAALRNQTIGRVERAGAATKEAASTKFQSSILGQKIASGKEYVGEKKESFAESLRGLAGIQTNKEKSDIEAKQLEEQKATRDAIEKLVETQTKQLNLSESEAENLRAQQLAAADLASGQGAAPVTPMLGNAGGGAAAGRLPAARAAARASRSTSTTS